MSSVPPTSGAGRWALLVGVDRYNDPAFATLKCCVADVLALQKKLKDLGYTVVCMHDQLDSSHQQQSLADRRRRDG